MVGRGPAQPPNHFEKSRLQALLGGTQHLASYPQKRVAVNAAIKLAHARPVLGATLPNIQSEAGRAKYADAIHRRSPEVVDVLAGEFRSLLRPLLQLPGRRRGGLDLLRCTY